jgi:hypothetical protein
MMNIFCWWGWRWGAIDAFHNYSTSPPSSLLEFSGLLMISIPKFLLCSLLYQQTTYGFCDKFYTCSKKFILNLRWMWGWQHLWAAFRSVVKIMHNSFASSPAGFLRRSKKLALLSYIGCLWRHNGESSSANQGTPSYFRGMILFQAMWSGCPSSLLKFPGLLMISIASLIVHGKYLLSFQLF